jgi:putative hemolysin
MLYFELLFVLLLTSINGLLAMSEMAVISSRRARLEHMVNQGHKGARFALRIANDPSRFLSTVQIGITLVGILAGAFSGATIADKLGDWLDQYALLRPYGDAIGIGFIVVLITFLSLILGELVPKRAALANPESIASIIARPMDYLSVIARPAVWLLGVSTEIVLRLFGLSGARDNRVTEEEIKLLIAEGAKAGVFEPQEHKMIQGVIRLADRSASVIMTPRADVTWVDVNADSDMLLSAIKSNRYSRLLVCENSIENAVGVVHAKDLLPAAIRHETLEIRSLMVSPVFVPERAPIPMLLENFRRTGVHMAVVVDEYGTTQGVVTLTDVLESIAGDLPELGEETDEPIVRDDEGAWLCEGYLPIDEFEDHTGLRGLRSDGNYQTIAGFVIHVLGHLPRTGETFTYRNAKFEIVDMDGRRINKVRVHLEAPPLEDG